MYTHLNLTKRLTVTTMQPAPVGAKEIPPFRLCKLYHFNYDPTKTWLLEFYQWNILSQKKERRFFSKFNHIKDPQKRLIEAQKWERFINQQLENGAVYNPNLKSEPTTKPATVKAPTFLEDLDAYLKHQKAVTAETSYKTYRAFVDKWKAFSKEFEIEPITAKDVTPAVCRDFVDYLLSLPNIGNRTRNNTIEKLKTACNYYTKPGRERWELSPARHLELFPSSTEEHEPFNAEQQRAILSEVEKAEDWPLLLFIYFIQYTFGRPGKEVRLLRVRDIRDGVVVYKSKYSKTDITKTPTIPKPLELLIQKLDLKSYNPDFYIFGVEGRPGPIPVHLTYFYRKHRKILEHLKLTDGYTLYSWKHTGNIKMYNALKNLKLNQEQNGHTSMKTTEIYLRKLGAFVNNDIYEKFV